jgi:hypothetical protein
MARHTAHKNLVTIENVKLFRLHRDERVLTKAAEGNERLYLNQLCYFLLFHFRRIILHDRQACHRGQ